jgi:uncharacterized membrane protein YeaQ/YmgE (transglycosylase-associated protein family)
MRMDMPTSNRIEGAVMSFTVIEVLLLLLIAAVCGALGQAISGVSRGGLLASIALGFIGALVGAWLSRLLALPEPVPIHIGETTFPVIWSIAGAALFLAVLGLLRRPTSRHD